MKLIKLAGVVLAGILLLVSSCKKKDIEITQKNRETLGSLSTSPAFAKPILSANENRIFTIVLKDGKQLNFNVTSAAQTMFGKKRTLAGEVIINNKKEKVVMFIGDNGFAINYFDNGHYFILQSKVELDLGYKQPVVDLNTADFKAQYAAYAQHNGKATAANILASYKKQLNNVPGANTDNQYNVVIEQTSLYTLIDRTLTEQKIAAADGNKNNELDTKLVDADVRSANATAAYNTGINPAVKFYKIEVAYIAPHYNSNIQFAYLCFSFIGLDPEMKHLCWLPLTCTLTDNKTSMQIVEIISRQAPVSSYLTQIQNLQSLSKTFPIATGVCRVGLYKALPWYKGTQWQGAHGAAYENCYNATGNSYSCLVVEDFEDIGLAHECGHNLGAVHVDNIRDVMNHVSGSYPPFHYDANNIKIIIDKFK